MQRIERENELKESLGEDNYNAIKREKIKEVQKAVKTAKNQEDDDDQYWNKTKRRNISGFSNEKHIWDEKSQSNNHKSKRLKKKKEMNLDGFDNENYEPHPVIQTVKSEVCVVL